MSKSRLANFPHAQISPFELFALILSSKLDKRIPVEQFRALSCETLAREMPYYHYFYYHYYYYYYCNSYLYYCYYH